MYHQTPTTYLRTWFTYWLINFIFFYISHQLPHSLLFFFLLLISFFFLYRCSADEEADALLDFNAVQRGDAEMENRLNRVIRACIEMGENNPIVSIHDQVKLTQDFVDLVTYIQYFCTCHIPQSIRHHKHSPSFSIFHSIFPFSAIFF